MDFFLFILVHIQLFYAVIKSYIFVPESLLNICGILIGIYVCNKKYTKKKLLVYYCSFIIFIMFSNILMFIFELLVLKFNDELIPEANQKMLIIITFIVNFMLNLLVVIETVAKIKMIRNVNNIEEQQNIISPSLPQLHFSDDEMAGI